MEYLDRRSLRYKLERDRALEWLEKACEERDPNPPYTGMPIYFSLRSIQRFRPLLNRTNLPQ